MGCCGQSGGPGAGAMRMTGRMLLAALVAGTATTAAAECREDRVTVQGDFGTANFTVQVADDPQERARGLMQVEEMGTLEGMLFVYEEPGPASFWMENTLIPLDMLFAGEDGTITRIHENAVPMDRTPIPGGDEVKFVLEINGGLSERLGIEVGDVLQHPAIGEGAALPCEEPSAEGAVGEEGASNEDAPEAEEAPSTEGTLETEEAPASGG